MDICINQYRQAIGLFQRCKLSMHNCCIGISGVSTTLCFLLICILIILCGDVEQNPGPSSKLRNLSICHANIRGLNDTKMLAIKTSLCSKFDIITLSETFLSQNSLADLTLPGYHNVLRRDRPTFGGGLAIFIRDCIVYKRKANLDSQLIENMWVEINTVDGKLLLCNIYRPPSDQNFWENFASNIENIKSMNTTKHLMILGDMNADFLSNDGKHLLEICDSYNVRYHVTSPTRITASSQTCLDQILSNIPNFISEISVDAPVSTNDHCTVGASVRFRIHNEKAYYRNVWLYDKGDYKGLKSHLSNLDWNNCFDDDDVDKACFTWTETFLNAARAYIPVKSILVRPKDSPWYNNELRRLKRKVIRIYRKAKANRATYWEQYKDLSLTYHSKLNEAEQQYKQNLNKTLAESKGEKSWWRTVKDILGKGISDSYPPILDPSNGEHEVDAGKKATLFNKFFLSHSKLDESNATLPPFTNEHDNKIVSIVTSEKEVLELIENVDISKATGPDGISPRLLKAAGSSITPSLTRLFNLCLSKQKVPDLWKKANVIPIHKKGDRDNLQNYRPVSILPITSKLFEKILFKNIYNFLHSQRIISDHQSGFKPGDSTVNQLAYLYHKFCEALDKKKDIRVIFCDISKAFDRVWHSGLIYKMKAVGIDGDLLRLLENYLCNRQQRVVIKGQTSEWGEISAGVPQGSVMGPLMFLIYINDLVTSVSNDINIKLFADDTLLYFAGNDHNISSKLLNDNLKKIQKWADQWLVTFNPMKTELLNISNKRAVNFDNHSVYFDNTKLQGVSQHKHLGVTFNSKLKWSNHIDNLTKGVKSMCDVMNRLKHSLSRSTLEVIYFTFVRPKLEYACIVFDDCTENEKNKLESIQLYCARIVTGAKRGTSHALLYKELNWPKLSERRKIAKCKFAYNLSNQNVPDYLSELMPHKVCENSQYSLRNKEHVSIPNYRTEKFKNSIIPDSVKMWNNLSSDVKNSSTIDSFKSALSKKCVPNKFFQGSQRKMNIVHCQIRLSCSNLNCHLYKLHVIDSPNCSCCNVLEDSSHFFLTCPLYSVQRISLCNEIQKYCKVSLQVLLYGNDLLSDCDNLAICKAVEQYIASSGRFNN